MFRWVPTDSTKLRYLTGCRQVEGGWSDGCLITLGRTNHQGRTITGRIYDCENKIHGIRVHDGQPKEVHGNEFEALVYNCANPWIE